MQKQAALAHDGGYSLPRPVSTPPLASEFALKWSKLFSAQPIATMSQPWTSVRQATERTWPQRHFILCTDYKGSPFHRIAGEVRGAPGWDYSEFDAPHDVVRTDPELTAGRIAQIARGWGVND